MLAAIYRFVGGFIPTGHTNLARLIFSVLMAASLGFAMIVKGYALDEACTVFVVSTFTTYAGRWFPHGWTWQVKAPWGYVFMSLIAFARVVLWLSPVLYYIPHLSPLCLFGLLGGVGYAIGKNYLDGVDIGIYYVIPHAVIKSADGTWNLMSHKEPSCFAKGWTEHGEVITGELCYALPYLLLLAL